VPDAAEFEALRKRVDELYLIAHAQSVALSCLVQTVPGVIEAIDRAAANLQDLMLATTTSDADIAYCKACLLAIAHPER
jgi:hypothetical protein